MFNKILTDAMLITKRENGKKSQKFMSYPLFTLINKEERKSSKKKEETSSTRTDNLF
jgi:hypothetical protein